MANVKKKPGNFCSRKYQVGSITLKDLENPWTFYALFGDENSKNIIEWMQTNGLLLKDAECQKCDSPCSLYKRTKCIDGYQFRCRNNKNHEISVRKFSFFERSKLDLRDIVNFIRTYLYGHNLSQCANLAGIHYKSTAVDWASFVREVMVEYVSSTVSTLKFTGTVEIDESLFGRKHKYHRGKSTGMYIIVYINVSAPCYIGEITLLAAGLLSAYIVISSHQCVCPMLYRRDNTIGCRTINF